MARSSAIGRASILIVSREVGVASNMQSANDAIWDAYFPQVVSQYTDPSFFDTDDDKEYKKKLKQWFETATKDEIQTAFARAAEAERRARYESLKQEFEPDV